MKDKFQVNPQLHATLYVKHKKNAKRIDKKQS